MRPPGSELDGERLAQYRRLEASPGPRDQWRVLEDCAAAKGQSLSARARGKIGVDPEIAALWFDGISLEFTEMPLAVALPDYPSVSEDRHRAASELGRLAGLGKIYWYEGGSSPLTCGFARPAESSKTRRPGRSATGHAPDTL